MVAVGGRCPRSHRPLASPKQVSKSSANRNGSSGLKGNSGARVPKTAKGWTTTPCATWGRRPRPRDRENRRQIVLWLPWKIWRKEQSLEKSQPLVRARPTSMRHEHGTSWRFTVRSKASLGSVPTNQDNCKRAYSLHHQPKSCHRTYDGDS